MRFHSRWALIGLMTMFGTLAGDAVMRGPQATRPGDFAFDPSRKHDRDFGPSGGMSRLSDSLFLFEDTCNVYLIKRDKHGALVGFGSGKVLERLRETGVETIDRVLLTHHHRNQVQGLADLKSYPFVVTIPAQEAGFFENVESFWDRVKIYLNYDCRSHWNTIRKSIRVDERATPGDTIDWRGMRFKVLETPGATDHAISYIADINGRRTVFCGDLISGAGKIANWYDMHWDYYGFTQGMDASEASFGRIRAEHPDLLLPAHGAPIDSPQSAMDANSRVYAALKEMLIPNELNRVQQQVRQILPHLVFVGSNCYAILSESGRAFLWDYGYVERERIAELKRQFHVTKIDAATFSHYHDDHTIRAWELTWEDASIWIHESMLDILENPTRYRLPCLVPMPIRADKVLHDGEKIRWEEYTFEFFHLPGQTEFHQGLSTVIDGKKVMFTGDNTWNKKDPAKTRNGPLVPHNIYFLDGGFITCAQKMLREKPDLVCPAHTEEYAPTVKDLEEFQSWAYRLRDVMGSLIDQPDPNFGMDVQWCHFYPYRSFVAPGDTCRIELMIRNHLFRTARIQVALKLSSELTCDQSVQTVLIDGKKAGSVRFAVRRASDSRGGREVITADITINDRRIGEFAEAIIDPAMPRD